MKKVISVVGARPNFMKVAPLHFAFRRYPSISHRIVHTGQHYDDNMSKVFFDDLELPRPDVYLGVGSGSHAVQTAKVMVEFERVVLSEKPDLVVVVGDVNSTVACSLVCAKLLVPVAHVEAGLRSFDRTMPEEINRVLTDAIADYLFVSEQAGIDNLRSEGVANSKVFLVGNVMIDSLHRIREKARTSKIRSSLGIVGRKYALVTLHRPSNVDDRRRLADVIASLQKIAQRHAVIFPIHPRTKKMIQEFGLDADKSVAANFVTCDPVGYSDFLALLEDASVVITDSGGIQEETTYLGIPCLTMRENTERPSTVAEGTNMLLGFDFEKSVLESEKAFDGNGKKGTVPALWDGKAAERIAEIIYEHLSKN